MFKRISILAGSLAVAGVLAATAAAVITADSGGAELRVDKRTNNQQSSTSNTVWSDVPGMSLLVHVPANTSRLYDVPFFAETLCNGPGTGVCTVRIIAINIANGAVVELNPQAGADYAFDSDMVANLDDLKEGHGMERSRRLSGGPNGTDYQIEVQYAVTNPNTVFTLDETHLAVHTNL